MGKSNSPNCAECDSMEDAYHILMECVRNEVERMDFVAKSGIDLYAVGMCNNILALPLSKEAEMLVKFVNIGIKRRR